MTGVDGRPAGRGAAWRVLRHGDYRLLWAGQFVSTAGSAVQLVAVAWQVYALTGSPVQLGLLGLLRAAPLLAFSLVGGVFADTIDRRRLLIVTQSTALLLSGVLALTTALGVINVGVIYAVTFLAGVTSAFNGPARQALIPALVPREELAAALTVNVAAALVATVLGPSLGGFVIAAAGLAVAYGVDAVSFAAVIAALVLMRADIRGPLAARRGGPDLLLGGLAFIRDNHLILAMLLLDFVAVFFGSIGALLPIYARDLLHVGAEGLGYLYTATSAGAMLGTLGLSARGHLRRPGLVFLVGIAAYGVCGGLSGLSHTLWLSLLLVAGSGAADAVSSIVRGTILQLATPDDLRGRVSAVYLAFDQGGPQLGQVRAGAVAQLSSAGVAAGAGGAIVVVATALVAALVPKVRRYSV